MNNTTHPNIDQDPDVVLSEAQQARHEGDTYRLVAIVRQDIIWTPNRCEVHARNCVCGGCK